MNLDAEQRERSLGDGFLALLEDPARCRIDCSRTVAAFAHPDDEAIAMGGQVGRLAGIRFLHVTDGAPACMTDALANGFSCREDYAAARKQELATALGHAGVRPEALLSLGAADQEAALHMAALAELLSATFRARGISLVITHAFEGGHPDHDATTFIVHAACRMLEGEGAETPAIVECPLYHARNGEWMLQDFAPFPRSDNPGVTVKLTAEAAECKRRMLAAHGTQQRTLAVFDVALERFRAAPRYDFTQLPNGGELLYEAFDWGLDGESWLRLAKEARRDLGLPQWF